MKISDFELLSTLPEQYDYQIMGNYKGPHFVIVGYKNGKVEACWVLQEGLIRIFRDYETQD